MTDVSEAATLATEMVVSSAVTSKSVGAAVVAERLSSNVSTIVPPLVSVPAEISAGQVSVTRKTRSCTAVDVEPELDGVRPGCKPIDVEAHDGVAVGSQSLDPAEVGCESVET